MRNNNNYHKKLNTRVNEAIKPNKNTSFKKKQKSNYKNGN